ncbi:C6 finger domain protein, putative [Talaromyces stipitatus ATCC 10500]|uniref:C6 finger domain protein, putative n=1 Tax=Talaromyces stipitatus (strain ATCC 10500 / CBS 375.48 / QM 6759 / NRRL 1006) TaxID=441959 RepID=B8MMP5_TALSN|nr:C6 finger domain protein, putative [Talaromyces stipitatus ATCC 10500]EED13612.1 C6 finger domain protein, putative [Talaromyces stipitatus ATCC 10500]
MGDTKTRKTEAIEAKAQPLAGKKSRRTLSCLSCQKRKLKCDRVKPCRACCMRGVPAECDYGTTKHDRGFIAQSDLIEELRAKLKKLEQKLAQHDEAVSQGTMVATSSDPDSSAVKVKSTTVKANNRSAWEVLSALNLRKALAESPTPDRLLMDVFVGEVINAFAPDPLNIHGRVFDLRSAAERRIFSPVLAAGFDATALIFVGQRDQNQKFLRAGNIQYNRALRLLQKAVNDPQQCTSTDALTMVVLVTVIEAVNQSSPGAIFKHQLGGLELLRLRTPYRHRTGLDQSLYIDLRMFWVTTAIANRKPTFLSSEEWLTLPWTKTGPQKDILHHLLDVAVDIPAFLCKHDTFKTSLSKGNLSQSELVSAHDEIQTTATILDQRLQLWHSVIAIHYQHGYMTEEPAEDFLRDSDAPRFYSRNVSCGDIDQPPVLIYPDLLLATTLSLYRALRLVIVGSDNDGLFSVLSSSERYQLAVDICRSMPYYLKTVSGYLVSRLMFVLRVSFDTFSEGMVEREYIEQLFVYIGEKYHLRVFSNQCSESATAGYAALTRADVTECYRLKITCGPQHFHPD